LAWEIVAADSLPDQKYRDLYDRVFLSGRLILQLHAWDEEHYPTLSTRTPRLLGKGIAWFQPE
jgi:hypothetical protein